MKRLRMCFYAVLLAISIIFGILNCTINNDIRQQHRLRQQQATSLQTLMLIRRYSPQHPQGERVPIAIAPWTTVGRLGQNISKFSTRSFVFADMATLDSNYGVPMTQFDKDEHQSIQSLLKQRLCLRSAKLQHSPQQRQSTWKCRRKVQVMKCVSCTEQDGTWYSAVSQTGAVFGRVITSMPSPSSAASMHHGKSQNDTSLQIHFPPFNDGPFMYLQLDIAVPIAGQDEKLHKFVARLGPAIRQFRSGLYGAKIVIRLLITRFVFDQPSLKNPEELENYRQNLTRTAGLTNLADEVVFVHLPNNVTEFSRAKAVNAIHRMTSSDDSSVLAVIDVDLAIGPKFLRNALTFPFPQASAYFPIMWSEYNPETVNLVDEFFPRAKHAKYSEHHGHWRKFSYGMYAIAGSDAPRLTMNESFVGWGGEDNDFFASVQKKLHVIRLQETGLSHIWHPKHCDLGGFVEDKYFRQCVASMTHFEGSQLGIYLRDLKAHDKKTFDEVMLAAKRAHDSEKKSHLPAELEDPLEENEDSPTMLVGVISSRQNFASRVRGIVQTWGDPQNIPEGTTLRFCVGAPEKGSKFFGKPEEDVANLANLAGLPDASSIVVMEGVVDDEYPPVRKNTAMIQTLNSIAETYENDADAPVAFQWIYKVDDDAYVNFDAMLTFLRTRSSEGYHVYGERGTGRLEDRKGLELAGLSRSYGTGGPGYLMSRSTVKDTALKLKDCVRVADASEQRKFLWHSDSVIGLCIYNTTGAGCWDGRDYYQNRRFRHNHHKEDPFLATSELQLTIAAHPFKDENSMMKQHIRYLEIAKST